MFLLGTQAIPSSFFQTTGDASKERSVPLGKEQNLANAFQYVEFEDIVYLIPDRHIIEYPGLMFEAPNEFVVLCLLLVRFHAEHLKVHLVQE